MWQVCSAQCALCAVGGTASMVNFSRPVRVLPCLPNCACVEKFLLADFVRIWLPLSSAWPAYMWFRRYFSQIYWDSNRKGARVFAYHDTDPFLKVSFLLMTPEYPYENDRKQARWDGNTHKTNGWPGWSRQTENNTNLNQLFWRAPLEVKYVLLNSGGGDKTWLKIRPGKAGGQLLLLQWARFTGRAQSLTHMKTIHPDFFPDDW